MCFDHQSAKKIAGIKKMRSLSGEFPRAFTGITKKFSLCLMASLLALGACKRAPLPPPIVLFDQGHGQHFLVEKKDELDLSKLGEAFVAGGFQVKSSAPGQMFTDDALKNVSTLIISGAFQPVTDDEVVVLKNFIDRGGQLCVMLHISSPLAPLLNNLGVAVSNGVVREQTNLLTPDVQTDFFVNDLAKHPLTKDLSQINFYGTWALNVEQPANVIAKTSPQAWVDLNNDKNLDSGDAIQAFSVVVTGQVGHGYFVVFADDAIFQNRFLVGPNQQLASNLVAWLKAGSYY
ncbi:MAG: hypothetical protein PHI06_11635 [Desulfobulbaceae bacterium]|nr:hypothetical protein [Desulfobulbaceae bacterium]